MASTREYNPGPPSTSRKKRTQIGARGLPRRRAVRLPFFEVATRSKKYDAKKRARKAIGARGVKTNARHTRKPYRVSPVIIEAAIKAIAAKESADRQAGLTTSAASNVAG